MLKNVYLSNHEKRTETRSAALKSIQNLWIKPLVPW